MANSLINTGGEGPPGPSIDVRDEGVQLTAVCTKINFVGAGVTATEPVTDEVDVTIPLTGALVKTAFTELTADSTTTAAVTAPVTLISLAITPDSSSNKFCIFMSASADNSSSSDRQIVFQVWYGLTGSETQQRSTYLFSDNGSSQMGGSCPLNLRLDALGAGEHTVQIRWGTSANTAECRPVANPDYDHCSVVVQEVSG